MKIDPIFMSDDDYSSEIPSRCLNCNHEDLIPDFIYDEFSKKIYHKQLKKEVYTLNCNYCEKECVVPINVINENNNIIIDKINNMSKEEIKNLFMDTIKILPVNEQDKISFYIKDRLGIEYDESIINDNFNEIKHNYKLIDNGTIYFDKLTYETGYEGWLGKSYESSYSVNERINNVLNYTYNNMIKCIYLKKYDIAIDICDLILYSDYKAKEIFVDDMFDEDNDNYELVSLKDIDDLPFNIKDIYLCKIYAIIMLNQNDKYKKIYEIYNETGINIEEALDKGIEHIDKSQFLEEWYNYLYKDDYLEYKNKKKKKKNKNKKSKKK